jgi:hypothetical protein
VIAAALRMRKTEKNPRVRNNLADEVLRNGTKSVIIKNDVFWDVAPCGPFKSRRFGGACRLPLQGRKNKESEKVLVTSSVLILEEKRSSETSVFKRPKRRHIPEDVILNNY